MEVIEKTQFIPKLLIKKQKPKASYTTSCNPGSTGPFWKYISLPVFGQYKIPPTTKPKN